MFQAAKASPNSLGTQKLSNKHKLCSAVRTRGREWKSSMQERVDNCWTNRLHRKFCLHIATLTGLQPRKLEYHAKTIAWILMVFSLQWNLMPNLLFKLFLCDLLLFRFFSKWSYFVLGIRTRIAICSSFKSTSYFSET